MEHRQPRIPSRGTTSANTKAIHQCWSPPSAVRNSTGHRANIDAAEGDPHNRQERMNGSSGSTMATQRIDEAETHQQQKRRGIVAGKRLEEGGTWREYRQPGIPSRSTTSATTEAIHRGWSHPSVVQKSTGHRANIDAVSTMAELCLTGGNEVYIHCASGTSRAPFATALLAHGIMAAAPSQAPGIDSSSPADYTTAMCIQGEVEPGMDLPLRLPCKRCYSQLSEAVPQTQGAP